MATNEVEVEQRSHPLSSPSITQSANPIVSPTPEELETFDTFNPLANVYYRFWCLTVNRCLFIYFPHVAQMLLILICQIIDSDMQGVVVTIIIHVIYTICIAIIFSRCSIMILAVLVIYFANYALNIYLFTGMLDGFNNPKTSQDNGIFAKIFFGTLFTDTFLTTVYICLGSVALLEAVTIDKRMEVMENLDKTKRSVRTPLKNPFPDEHIEFRFLRMKVTVALIISYLCNLFVMSPLVLLAFTHKNTSSMVFIIARFSGAGIFLLITHWKHLMLIFFAIVVECTLFIFWFIIWIILIVLSVNPDAIGRGFVLSVLPLQFSDSPNILSKPNIIPIILLITFHFSAMVFSIYTMIVVSMDLIKKESKTMRQKASEKNTLE